MHFLRDVCENVIENNPQVLGGFDGNNEPIEVEIDESKFFTQEIPPQPLERRALGIWGD